MCVYRVPIWTSRGDKKRDPIAPCSVVLFVFFLFYPMAPKSRTQNHKKQSLVKKAEAAASSSKTQTVSKPSPLLYEAVSLLILFTGFLLFLSFFGVLGRAGDFLDAVFSQIFGSFRYFASLGLVVLAYVRFRFSLRPFTGAQIFGVFLFICSSSGLFHAFVPLENSMALALRGEYGGVLGFFFSYPLLWLFGAVGAILLLLVFWIVSLLFVSQKTFFELIMLCRTILSHPTERTPQPSDLKQP
jgi:S-DNA-T family DNA segregation ATPase FtsK/SpoIIIE